MTGKEAIKNFTDYLKQHNISHVTDIDNGCQRYTMTYSAENAPNYYVESGIWFYDHDVAEARCYYTALGGCSCRNSGLSDSILSGTFRQAGVVCVRGSLGKIYCR